MLFFEFCLLRKVELGHARKAKDTSQDSGANQSSMSEEELVQLVADARRFKVDLEYVPTNHKQFQFHRFCNIYSNNLIITYVMNILKNVLLHRGVRHRNVTSCRSKKGN